MSRSSTLKLAISTLMLAAFLGAGCARSVPGKESLVGSSGRKSLWVRSDVRSFKKDGMMYFRGQAIRTADLSLGIRQAEADAKKRLIGKIAESITTEYSEYMTSDGNVPAERRAFVAEGIAWTSDRVRLAGVEPVKIYWEKMEVARPYGIIYSYNVYTLLQIPESDYWEAKNTNGARTTKDTDDRKAEEAAARLKEKAER